MSQTVNKFVIKRSDGKYIIGYDSLNQRGWGWVPVWGNLYEAELYEKIPAIEEFLFIEDSYEVVMVSVSIKEYPYEIS